MHDPNCIFCKIAAGAIPAAKVYESENVLAFLDIEPIEKIRIFDTRIERPPHYNSLGEFQYAYHYGDSHIPRIDQTEPLMRMSRHFLDCIQTGKPPMTTGRDGLEVVSILEACSLSLKNSGGQVAIRPAGTVSPVRTASIP